MGDVCGALLDSIGINDADGSVGLGFVHPWLILGLGFLAGCGFALTDPAWHAPVGDILHQCDIPAAMTIMSVGSNIARSVGPALGRGIAHEYKGTLCVVCGNRF